MKLDISFNVNNNGGENPEDLKCCIRKEQLDAEYYNLFDLYDKNKDGVLRNAELDDVFESLNIYAGTDNKYDMLKNEILESTFERLKVPNVDFMGFVRSIVEIGENVVSSEEKTLPDGGKELIIKYKDNAEEVIAYYPEGEHKFTKFDQEYTKTEKFYTIGDNLDKQYTEEQIETMIKNAYEQKLKFAGTIHGQERITVFVPSYGEFREAFYELNNINEAITETHISKHNLNFSKRAKKDMEIKEFILNHYVETQNKPNDEQNNPLINIKEDTLHFGRFVWNQLKSIYREYITDEVSESSREKFAQNSGVRDAAKTKAALNSMKNNPIAFFTSQEANIDISLGEKFKDIAGKYTKAYGEKAKLELLDKALRELQTYQGEYKELQYGGLKSEGFIPYLHVENAANLLSEFFEGNESSVDDIISGVYKDTEGAIKRLTELRDEIRGIYNAILGDDTYEELEDEYKKMYKELYKTDVKSKEE